MDPTAADVNLWTAVVLDVTEDAATVWSGAGADVVHFAPPFPSPRRERVSPGHLVAVATRSEAAAELWAVEAFSDDHELRDAAFATG